MDEGRHREVGDERGEWLVHGSEQLEELREARDRVVAGQEVGEDVAAADGAGEDDVVLRGCTGEIGERRRRAHDLELRAVDEAVDLARHGDGERELAAPSIRDDQPQKEEQRLFDRHFPRLLVDEVKPLSRAVEDGAEACADGRDEPLRLLDRRSEPVRRVRGLRSLPRERVRGDDLHAERSEHERQNVGGAGPAVVDDDAEAARTHALDVDRRQEIGGVRLVHSGGIRDAADLGRRDAPQLAAREVLLHLFLHRRAHLDARRLEELDADDLGVGCADADVEAGVVAFRLHEVARDGGRAHAKVGDVNSGRREAGDHRALDHPARGRPFPARDDAHAAFERAAERRGESHRDVRREVDVDHARDPLLAEEARRAARLPDEALVQLRPRLDLLERIDPDAREDHALAADRHLVADRDALVDADVRAQVATAPDDRALDLRAAPDVRRAVDHRPDDARAFAHGHARPKHGVRADARAARNAAVATEIRRPLDRVEIVEVHPVPQPDVAADADAGDVQADSLLERVDVRLAELVEVPDVLPVAVEDVPVDRPAHLEEKREELLREVVRPVGRDVLQDLGLEDVDAGVDRVGEDLAPRRLLEETLDAALVVGDDDPELERVLDRLQADRHGCLLLPVERDEARQVDVAEGVAGDDEERVVEATGGETHGASRAERRFLHRIADVDAEALAVAEVAADRLWQERDGDDDVLEAVELEQFDDVLHARLADDRDHRLRLVRGERSQARALSPRHDDRLHFRRAPHASRT